MQKVINETLDFGIPGEFASTNPRSVDVPYEVAVAVTLGRVVAAKDNLVAPVGTSGYTAVKGIAVSPHQKVNRGSAGNALAPTMEVKVGDEITIVKMGDVYVEASISATVDAITGKDTEAEAIAAAKTALDDALVLGRGTTLYYTSTGVITPTVNANQDIGTVRDAGKATDVVYTVAAAKDSSTQKWGVASPSATAKAVVALAINA